MGMTLVLQQMIVLFLMMAAGYAANRCRVMSKESEQLFSKLIVNLTCPALIINSVTTSGRLESMGALFAIFGAAAVYYVLLPLLSKGLVRLLRVPAERAAEYESMLVYSNLGFMGIPVANAVLGPDSVLYLSIFMAVFNISVFSYGTLLIQPGEGGKVHFRKMVNPGTVSAVAAILLYLLEVQLPSLILQPVASIGSTTTPLAMLVIGSSQARQPLREVLQEKSLLPFTLLRLLVLPAAVLLVCRWFLHDPMLLGALVLVSAMPVASNVVMLCNELGRDSSYISKGVFFSTVFSVVTLPLISLLLSAAG